MLEVDLFLDPPIEFELLWARAEVTSLRTTELRIASIQDLILMKRLAGRPEDAIDIQALEEIRRRKRG